MKFVQFKRYIGSDLAMTTTIETKIKEYEFKLPNKDNEDCYQLFPEELENDPLVLFHGTETSNLQSILKKGFLPANELDDIKTTLNSVSYAKNSNDCLMYVCSNKSHQSTKKCVIAVRFKNLNCVGIRNNNSDIYVDDVSIQPEIIGVCFIPIDYNWV
ncbi:MAG: hypothetical protein COC24_000220 [Alphaproteobacteria bacterium]|nr:hypothetical protein [Alphaproteobacteria bacterium]